MTPAPERPDPLDRWPRTAAGGRLFTDNEPMDMLESNGVTWDDIRAVEDEAAHFAAAPVTDAGLPSVAVFPRSHSDRKNTTLPAGDPAMAAFDRARETVDANRS